MNEVHDDSSAEAIKKDKISQTLALPIETQQLRPKRAKQYEKASSHTFKRSRRSI